MRRENISSADGISCYESCIIPLGIYSIRLNPCTSPFLSARSLLQDGPRDVGDVVAVGVYGGNLESHRRIRQARPDLRRQEVALVSSKGLPRGQVSFACRVSSVTTILGAQVRAATRVLTFV